MSSIPYRSIRDLISLIDEPAARGCRRILQDHARLLDEAAGAIHNHQTWEGGYLDHIREVMNLATVLYPVLDQLRSLPFSCSDALLVLFLHDLEKPWRNSPAAALEFSGIEASRAKFESDADKQTFRLALARRYEIPLSPELENAMDYIEGEGPRYNSGRRRMGPLGAFCHVCDTLSARLWFEHPASNDQWSPPRGESA